MLVATALVLLSLAQVYGTLSGSQQTSSTAPQSIARPVPIPSRRPTWCSLPMAVPFPHQSGVLQDQLLAVSGPARDPIVEDAGGVHDSSGTAKRKRDLPQRYCSRVFVSARRGVGGVRRPRQGLVCIKTRHANGPRTRVCLGKWTKITNTYFECLRDPSTPVPVMTMSPSSTRATSTARTTPCTRFADFDAHRVRDHLCHSRH
ncbi:hypothetical protein BASA82_000571 [Batrachochytrium salamandrivorans]|nr:hypothetical protein BASA82_000571 [Batrachochytrium salamandrivorans]